MNMTTALENLLTLNIYTGSVDRIVPWLLASAAFCFALTWIATRHGFRSPVWGSHTPADTETFGLCVLFRMMQICALVLVVAAVLDSGRHPEVLFEDEVSPTQPLKITLLYPAVLRLGYYIFITTVVYSHATDRRSTLSDMFASPMKFLLVGSLLLCQSLAALVCVLSMVLAVVPYYILWDSSHFSIAGKSLGTLGNYVTLVVLGQSLCARLEFPMIAGIAVDVITANCYKEKKTIVNVLSVLLMMMTVLSLLSAADFVYSMLDGRIPRDNMGGFAEQISLLVEAYVAGNLYILVRLYIPHPGLVTKEAEAVEAQKPVEGAEKV